MTFNIRNNSSNMTTEKTHIRDREKTPLISTIIEKLQHT
jgi:hypothetical protein